MMRLKRILVWLTVTCLIFGMLAGCGTGQAVSGSTYGAESRAEEQKPAETGKTETGKTAESREETESEKTSEPESTEETERASEEEDNSLTVDEDGSYTDKERVALYIHLYGQLPKNFITKKDAEKLGWDSKAGNLDQVAPGMSIGGSRFGNYEGMLPEKKGRRYYECDIDFDGGYRGAKRLIYSDDGLIFYTEDHYKTFEQLY